MREPAIIILQLMRPTMDSNSHSRKLVTFWSRQAETRSGCWDRTPRLHRKEQVPPDGSFWSQEMTSLKHSEADCIDTITSKLQIWSVSCLWSPQGTHFPGAVCHKPGLAEQHGFLKVTQARGEWRSQKFVRPCLPFQEHAKAEATGYVAHKVN